MEFVLRKGKLATVSGSGGQHQLSYEVLELVAAEQHGEELASIHEIDVQALHSVCIVPFPQLHISQHLHACPSEDEMSCQLSPGCIL